MANRQLKYPRKPYLCHTRLLGTDIAYTSTFVSVVADFPLPSPSPFTL